MELRVRKRQSVIFKLAQAFRHAARRESQFRSLVVAMCCARATAAGRDGPSRVYLTDLAVFASTDDPSLSSHGLRARHHEVINVRVEPMRMADRCPICSVRPTCVISSYVWLFYAANTMYEGYAHKQRVRCTARHLDIGIGSLAPRAPSSLLLFVLGIGCPFPLMSVKLRLHLVLRANEVLETAFRTRGCLRSMGTAVVQGLRKAIPTNMAQGWNATVSVQKWCGSTRSHATRCWQLVQPLLTL
jgi:hypothetical protein